MTAFDGEHAPGTHDALIGHSSAIAEFEAASASGRLHHAWLITGPEGIGKATLAYRLARFLLAGGEGDVLSHTLEQPTARKIAGGGHSNLMVLERAMDRTGKRLKTELTVDVIRQMNGFFGTTAGEGGKRVTIVDSADDMNATAANALLKNLEEPPAQAVFFVLSHRPGRLLPTIRSRCRVLALKPLSSSDVEIALASNPEIDAPPQQLADAARLSQGSVGRATKLLTTGGLEMASDMQRILSGRLPDWSAIHPLAQKMNGRDAQPAFEMLLNFWKNEIALMVREFTARPSPDLPSAVELADYSQWLGDQHDRTVGLNLDQRQFLLSAFDRWFSMMHRIRGTNALGAA